MKARIGTHTLFLSLLASLPAPAAPPAESPYSLPQAPFYGQLRPRSEYDSKDVRDSLPNKPLLGTHLRTRIGFVASPSPNTEVKVEIQDVRFMGSEVPSAAANPATATTANSRGVDLSQGYFAIEEGPFKTAFGRQKLHLGAGRFLSTLEWSPTARMFDGWTFNVNLDPANLTGILFLVRDTNTASVTDRQLLGGLYYSHQLGPDVVAEAYSFYDQGRLRTIVGPDTTTNHDLAYFGQRVAGKAGTFAFEEEFIWQGGELNKPAGDKTSAAFQLATRLGVVMGPYKANAGVDMMSGDDNPADGDFKTYRANYYFAHALFGWMDYFVNNPRYGVIDYRLDADIALLPNALGNPRVTFKPQYHFFTPQSAPSGADDPYGQEFDLEAHLGLYPKSNIVLGAGLFLPGGSAFRLPAAKITGAFSDQPGWFLYVMPVFNF